MKLNKKVFSIIFACGLMFSCTHDFEEINRNPNGPTKIPSVLLLTGIVEGAMDLQYSIFNGGDMGSCWAQHWSKVQYNDEERYKPRSTQFDAIWNALYAGAGGGGGIQDAKIMYELALEEGNENLQGIAILLRVYLFSVLTDVYGDIPYTEALKANEGINSPKYDSQEEIYNNLLSLLDDANNLLDTNGGTITSTSDIVYGGNYLKWKKFANSLKFRLLMRISNRADFNRQAELQDIIDNRVMFTSNADEAKLVYLASAPNNNPVNQSIIGGNRAEFKVNSVLVDMLTSTNDPRLPVFAQLNSDGIYRGKPSGIINVPSTEWDYPNVSAIGTAYLSPTAPAFLLSYAEQELLIAEAAKRGLIAGGDSEAETHYNNGVLASMSSNGVATASANQYLTDHPYNAGSAISQIQTEKWISLFGQGIEAWTEWRRTKIPALSPAIEAAIGEIPSRYQYPPTEQALNGTNYSNAIQIQGPDLLTTKVWWMN